MRLFESIIDANHRAVAGDNSAGLHPAEFADELPVIALTCIDPRLNALFPNVLGIPAEQFIWLRNAGNIITSPLSSTMRSLALACAVKGGREIAIIGHTDCQVARTTTMQLLEKLKAIGVERSRLPENLNEFFGMFVTERQNVIKACDLARQSPLIGPKIPIHGLLADIETGKLEWIVNGYETLQQHPQSQPAANSFPQLSAFNTLGNFDIGEMKFPETKIGELAAKAGNWVSSGVGKLEVKAQEEIQNVAPAVESVETIAKQAGEFAEKHWPKPSGTPPLLPPKIPLPPPIRPRLTMQREKR
jgi:carbonic anhydrase